MFEQQKQWKVFFSKFDAVFSLPQKMATKNDKLVLNTIFNPFEPNLDSDDDEQPDDGTCPVHPNGSDQNGYPLDRLKQIEVEGIKLAEEGKLLCFCQVVTWSNLLQSKILK